MKKIYLIFFLSITMPLFLSAQQNVFTPQQPVPKKPQPTTTITKAKVHSPVRTPVVTNGSRKGKPVVKRRKKITTGIIYGNEWINYSQYYYKIKVAQNGIYRIDSTALAKAGIPVNTINNSNYQVYFRGQQQYIYVRSKTTNLSEANGDYIEFYGQYNDGAEDSLLYYNIKFLPNPYYSLFNDTSTYYLTWGSAGLRMAEQADTVWTASPAPYVLTTTVAAGRATSTASANSQSNTVSLLNGPYSAGAFVNDGAYTPNDPRFTQNSAWTYNWVSYSSYESFSFDVGNTYTTVGAPFAFLRTVVLGENLGSCTFDIVPNFGTAYNNINCNGFQAIDTTITFASGTIPTSVKYFNTATSNTNLIAPVYAYLSYPHSLKLDNDTTFSMVLNNGGTVGAETYLDFTNISTRTPIDTIRMYDLTNHNRFWVKREAGGNFKVLAPNTGNLQQCYLTSDGVINKVTSLSPVGTNYANGRAGNGQFTNFLSEPGNAFIIITHPSLWQGALSYKAYRASKYNTVIANVEELYDQFGGGVDYSPLGIRRFCNYAINKWTAPAPPAMLFLIGKGIHTHLFRPDTAKWTLAQLLVPSYGDPSSDILFTNGLGIDSTMLEPGIPTGRLAAQDSNQVSAYLTKVETFESSAAAPWMKNIAHFAGGATASEENIYASYLDEFATSIMDTVFGGNVSLFQKSTPNPISGSLTDSITTLINSGVSIMTFFGHASGSNWDESVDYPSDYTNYNKYPFMIADACFSGDIFQPIGDAISSVSEQWVLGSPGAIGFLASDYLGNPPQLADYTQQIYNDISWRPFYRKPIGEIIQNTIGTPPQTNINELMICTCLEMTLHGDPAIAINGMDSLPDYAVNNQSIYFTPANVTVLQDSFDVHVIVYNYGEALNQTIFGTLTRNFPSGAPPEIHTFSFTNLYYQDTVTFRLPVDQSIGAGLNYFTVFVDLDPSLPELTYANNSIANPGVPLWITSEDITPVWPYDYAIIPKDTVTLKASTNDPFAPQRTYIFEIDTSHSFNSPLFRSDTVTNSGGVIMVHPDANWGTTHFAGLLNSGNNGRNRITSSGNGNNTNVSNSQNLGNGKLGVVQNSSGINKLAMQQQSPSSVAKQSAIGVRTTQTAQTQNITGVKINSPLEKLHKKLTGPIRDSFINNAVYYWRVRRDTADSLLYPWVNTSFQYIKNKNGWGQSNFFQYDNDEIFNDNYDYINFNSPPRGWSFNTGFSTLQCFTFGMPTGTNLYATKYTINDYTYGYAGCQYFLGIYVAVIDKTTLQPWDPMEHDYFQANGPHNTVADGCDTGTTKSYFEYWDYDSSQMVGLVKLLKAVPAGDYILAYSWLEGAFKKSSGLAYADSVIPEFTRIGASRMLAHATTPGEDSVPWAFFVQKGNIGATVQQAYGLNAHDSATITAPLNSNGTYGAITTPLIGPAAKYDSLSWFQHSNDHPNADSTRLNIIGIEPNGTSKILIADITPIVANMYISSISPVLFPYLQLMLYTKDALNRTPAQMNWWRVFYQPVPEIAMNPNVYTYFHADTLAYGDVLNFQTTVQNISDWPIDSTQLLIWTTNASNLMTPHNPTRLVKPLNPGDTAKISFTMPDAVSATSALQSVWFEINPEGYSDTRLEQYHFNDYAEKTFYSYGDKINPVLDVTFNGIHILNNDIVSAQPAILITFMDENKFLALNNSGDFKVYLNPVGSPASLIPFGSNLSFTPAVLPQNRCSMLLTPTLADGTYQLTVQGTDISGNLSANNSYTIDFQVINKPMISEVLNYPNPFSTSTRFVFILTGVEIPTLFKIQVMTVSGKIVREITQDEIGPIHIGRNITQYAWDGTDQYGAKLANGVYLYRVITSLNGQSIDDYQTPADQYFTKNWGKMYLMR
jgi:hypothetical protein